MKATWIKPFGIKEDVAAAKFNYSSEINNAEIAKPCCSEMALLGLVVILFFIPLVWHFSLCALLSIY